jgi:hypothetical protein
VVNVCDNGDITNVFHVYVLVVVGVQRARNMEVKCGGVNEYACDFWAEQIGKAIDRVRRIP